MNINPGDTFATETHELTVLAVNNVDGRVAYQTRRLADGHIQPRMVTTAARFARLVERAA